MSILPTGYSAAAVSSAYLTPSSLLPHQAAAANNTTTLGAVAAAAAAALAPQHQQQQQVAGGFTGGGAGNAPGAIGTGDDDNSRNVCVVCMCLVFSSFSAWGILGYGAWKSSCRKVTVFSPIQRPHPINTLCFWYACFW